jgi:hypothetical protein
MRVYHFCAEKHIKKILREGISKGGVYLPRYGDTKSVELFYGYQWVTLDPEKKNQSWNTREIVRYDRTAFRLTLEIPDDSEGQILTRDQLEKEVPGSGVLFDFWPGSENWRVYHGWILPEWIVSCERMDGK